MTTRGSDWEEEYQKGLYAVRNDDYPTARVHLKAAIDGTLPGRFDHDIQ